MLIVNVDLVPHGRAAQTRTIARAAIVNVGPKDLDREFYCYDAWISKEDPFGDRFRVQLDTSSKPDVSVVHQRDLGALVLVRTILNTWGMYEQTYKDGIAEDEEKKDRSEAYAKGAPKLDRNALGFEIYGSNRE